MILLSDETEKLEVSAGFALTLHMVSNFVDFTATTTEPDSHQVAASTAADHVVVPAPSASTRRQIKSLTVQNGSSSSQSVQVKKRVGATPYNLTPELTLGPGESLCYIEALGFSVFTSAGVPRQAQVSKVTGNPYKFFKVGTATEAGGVAYCALKDSGYPGAMTLPTPGLNGVAISSSTAGSLPIKAPSTGVNYLTHFNAVASAVSTIELFDLLWVNSGIAVTTTTAQAISPAAAAARDNNNSADGQGVMAALLVTAATTNASAISNAKISYTNSAGVSGLTGTMASFPATAVVGSLVFFLLQAGDRGVRSIQSITLGTSLVTGSVALVLMRSIVSASVISGNTGTSTTYSSQGPGIALAPGACLVPVLTASAATAVTFSLNIVVEER